MNASSMPLTTGSPPRRAARHRLLLLVEDDRTDREAILRYTANNKLPVLFRTAASVEAAEELISKEEFDAALVDYRLGGRPGTELLVHTDKFPIVIVTGLDDTEFAVDAMRRGASDLLLKDAQGTFLELLLPTVERAIRNRESNSHSERAQTLHRQLMETNHLLNAVSSALAPVLEAVQMHCDNLLRLCGDNRLLQVHADAALAGASRAERALLRLREFTWSLARPTEPRTLDPREALNAALVDLGSELKSAKVEIGPMPAAIADPEILRQVFVQLLRNSLEHAAKDPLEIRISGSVQRARSCIVLEDNGIGVPSELVQDLLDPSQRRTALMGNKELGVGLPVCQRLLDRMGGSLRLSSAAGSGMKVEIELPAARDASAQP